MHRLLEIQCIDLPPLIRVELKERYNVWYSRCRFLSTPDNTEDLPRLVVCPAEHLIHSGNKYHRIKTIAFGNPELLESAFMLGADNFLKDPWNCGELIARSSRFLNAAEIPLCSGTLYYNGFIFHYGKRELVMTPLQNRLLFILMDNVNEFLSCKELSELSRPGNPISKSTLYSEISYIRKALKETLPRNDEKSITIRNSHKRGYMLATAVDNLCKTVDKL